MKCVFLCKNKVRDTNSVAEEMFIAVITEFSNNFYNTDISFACLFYLTLELFFNADYTEVRVSLFSQFFLACSGIPS